jgi:hypothetical protein
MSDDNPKSELRQLLESGPTDKKLLEKLTLLEALRAAAARSDKAAMLEIGRKLKANERQLQAAELDRRAAMTKAIEKAEAEPDPEARTAQLLAAFELCAKTRVIAYDEAADAETGHQATRHLFTIAAALDAVPPGRRTALVPLLDSADLGIKVSAAIALKDLMPDRALPILREINATAGNGAIGMAAYWALPRDDPSLPQAPTYQEFSASLDKNRNKEVSVAAFTSTSTGDGRDE